MLYLECRSGISGDMFVASMLDLGADEAVLRAALASLPLDGYRVVVSFVSRAGVRARDFDVVMEGPPQHEHRNLADIRRIIDQGMLTENARSLALSIFECLAEAEGEAHGVSPDEVHFHEVGAVDSIIDIVAAAVCFDNLGFKRVACSALHEGSGQVRCQHGILPIPVPAVVNLLRASALTLKITDAPREQITPTGAAIAVTLRNAELPAAFRIARLGIGAGKRNPAEANVLRAMRIVPETPKEEIIVLETNLDDATGEVMGLALEKLFAAGARDVHYSPVYMKKNRPGYLLRVIADAPRRETLERVIFENTPAIGLRYYPVERTILARRTVVAELPCGSVEVKISEGAGHRLIQPEFESVRKLSETTNFPFADLYEAARRAARKL